MTSDFFIEYSLSRKDVYKDFPFDDKWLVTRHIKNKKCFTYHYNRDGKDCINLKCDIERTDFYRQAYSSVIPGYHMNKAYWNTIILDGTIPDDEILNMIDISYELTKPKIKRKLSK